MLLAGLSLDTIMKDQRTKEKLSLTIKWSSKWQKAHLNALGNSFSEFVCVITE